MPDLSCNINLHMGPTRGTAPQSKSQRSPNTWQIQCTTSSNWSLPGEGRTDHNLTTAIGSKRKKTGRSAHVPCPRRSPGWGTWRSWMAARAQHSVATIRALTPIAACLAATVTLIIMRSSSSSPCAGTTRVGVRSKDICSGTWRGGGDERWGRKGPQPVESHVFLAGAAQVRRKGTY
jgi:hypothetical protein